MKKNGYSLIVLIIAVAVILIISSSAITIFKNTQEDKEIANFIYDINVIEDQVLEYYSETGVLPVNQQNKILINNIVIDSTQISELDNETYYKIDLSKLKISTLKDENRGYILNEKSLKVYVENPVTYKEVEYYTVTSTLVGNEEYEKQDVEYIILGNPANWVETAKIRLSISNIPNEELANWTFMWDNGPKQAEYFEDILNNGSEELKTEKAFTYGEIIEATSNGTYSIYVKKNVETIGEIINIVINKIDDIKPTITLETDNKLNIIDAETGIKLVNFKTSEEVEANVNQLTPEETSGYTKLECYLLNGKGEDVFILPTRIAEYNAEKTKLEEENQTHNTNISNLESLKAATSDEEELALIEEQIEAENERHTLALEPIMNKITEMETNYPYLVQPETYRLQIYVEDYAGNVNIIGAEDAENITLKTLTNTYGW